MGLTITMFSSFTVIKRFMRTQESWPLFPRTLHLKHRQKGPLVSHALEGPTKGQLVLSAQLRHVAGSVS